jgi:hypothetical protein
VVLYGAVWLVAYRSGHERSGPDPQFVRLPFVSRSSLPVDDGSSETDSLVLEGIAAYERHDYEIARRLLAGQEQDRGMDKLRRVYLASAQLECDMPESALVTLARVKPAQLSEPWRSESEWTRIVALSRTGQRASADSLLNVLGKGAGPARDRARRLREAASSKP